MKVMILKLKINLKKKTNSIRWQIIKKKVVSSISTTKSLSDYGLKVLIWI